MVTTLARRMQNRTDCKSKKNNAEVAQLVEHNLAPEDKRSQPWQDECKNRQTAKAKENNAEVTQFTEV
ncbi:hypothetical protein [Tannerella forsythia]|uniref:Uncharacterized protein n=2 Tax=Tannerella forsythia TaxID=28112 RepID=A0A2A6E683_TANFO|nr:hypothetical protein [Tannerella forsythia]PDP43086.1 hypothetical protein CLI86_10035 [Tannerella forsythia]